MSVPGSIKIKCGNCSKESEHFGWLSTHAIGPCDLDTRPPNDYRFAMKTLFVERCPACNYCYGNIRNISKEGKYMTTTTDYLNQVDNKKYPNGANQFLCKAMILEAEGNIFKAAWTYLHAAWCCDDSNNYIQAKTCRSKSIELFQLSKNIGDAKFENDGDYVCVLVDLYRKCENFLIAKKLAELRYKIETKLLCKQILFYQLSLCDNEDVNTYTDDKAISHFENNHHEQEENSGHDID